MILSETGGLTVVVVLALLKRQDGTTIRWFGTADQVEKFLRANPDQPFFLEAVRLGSIIPEDLKAGHGVDAGDIVCGQVKYDSAIGMVVCS